MIDLLGGSLIGQLGPLLLLAVGLMHAVADDTTVATDADETTTAPRPTTTTSPRPTTTTLTAPQLSGPCGFVNSTGDSLTFRWPSATSAAFYRLVGDGVNETSATNTITVDDLTPGSRYTFTVTATSSQGLGSNNITCINTTDPAVPTEIEVNNITQTSVRVSWSKGDTHFVNATQVYYRATDSTAWKSIDATSTSHNVTSLKPGTEYQFFVEINSYGKTSTSANITATTAPEIRGQCEFVNSTSRSLTFRWTSAQSATSYRLVGHLMDKSPPTNITTVNNLTAGSRYTFTVWAVGYKQLVSNNITCVNSTDPDVPSDTTVSDITQTSVRVSWSKGDTQFVNVTQVYYRATDTTTWTPTSATGTSHTVTSLKPGTQYQFFVKINSYGKTSTSANITATTAPFQNGTCNSASSTSNSVDLYWQPTRAASYYQITYRQLSGTMRLLNVSSTSVTVTSLTAGYLYTFYLQSFGDGGPSQKSNCSYSTYPEISAVLTVTDVTQTSVRLSWSIHRTQHIDRLQLYQRQLDSAARWLRWSPRNTSSNSSHTVTSLTAGTTYEFYVLIDSYGNSAETDTTRLTTAPGIAGACDFVTSTNRSLTFRWPSAMSATFYRLVGDGVDETSDTNIITVTDLTPGSRYSFTVWAVGSDGLASNNVTCTNSTDPDVSARVIRIGQYAVTVSWSTGLSRVIDDTYIRYKDIESSVWQIVQPTSPDEHVISSLSPGHTYDIRVIVHSFDKRRTSNILRNTTKPFLDKCSTYISTNRSLTFMWEEAKSATRYEFVGHSVFESPTSPEITVDDLIPGSRYTFTVTAVGSGGLDSNSITCSNSTQPDVPTKPEVSDIKQTSVKLSWQPGESRVINETSIVYQKKSEDQNSQTITLSLSSANVDRARRSAAEPAPAVFLLSGLEPASVYVIHVVVQSFDKTSRSLVTEFETLAETPVAIIAAVVVVFVIIVIIAVIIIFIIWRRRRRRRSPEQDEKHPDQRTSVGKKESLFPANSTKPVPFHKFSEHVAMLQKDSGLEYTNEFEDIKLVGKDQAWDQADLPSNRAKNRYANIKPYDVSRVKLLPVEDDEEGSDYINACWIPGFNSKREFIATQGPLPSTKDDFWRMVWEYDCRAIVMVTKCVEAQRTKCDRYWPSDMEPIFYGDLQVTIIGEDSSCHIWTITELQISMGQKTRRLRHFHYLEWPDNGVPDESSLLSFVEVVRDHIPVRGGPIVVHCSAGVGRTGTFIAIDTLLHQIRQAAQQQQQDQEPTVDVYGVVYRMRMNRVMMVQTEGQYIFINDVIKSKLESLGYGVRSPADGDGDDDGDGDGDEEPIYQNQPQASASARRLSSIPEVQGNFYYSKDSTT